MQLNYDISLWVSDNYYLCAGSQNNAISCAVARLIFLSEKDESSIALIKNEINQKT